MRGQMGSLQRFWRVKDALFLAAVTSCLALPALAQSADAQEGGAPHLFVAGAYGFSDALGGFRILSVTGTGTRDDPIIVTEELKSATPVTLTIRTVQSLRVMGQSGYFASGTLHMRIRAINGGGQGWIEFGFELQEVKDRPSSFGDGLSFDQRREDQELISSDTFKRFSRDFEPSDELLFREGSVDVGATASFSFVITDFTPRWEFYLVQDPRIPAS